MTVYVVTSGEYSAYRIDGVFSTEDKAKQFMGNTPAGSYCIEPYELDSEQPRVYGPMWVVTLRLDGSVESSWMREDDISEEHYAGDRGSGQTVAGFYDDRRILDKYNTAWFHAYSYVSADHALKLAAEQRQKALREHPDYFIPPTPEQVKSATEELERQEHRWQHSYPHHV